MKLIKDSFTYIHSITTARKLNQKLPIYPTIKKRTAKNFIKSPNNF